jgi:hypothetical protein
MKMKLLESEVTTLPAVLNKLLRECCCSCYCIFSREELKTVIYYTHYINIIVHKKPQSFTPSSCLFFSCKQYHIIYMYVHNLVFYHISIFISPVVNIVTIVKLIAK